jgi:hypothetical protein
MRLPANVAALQKEHVLFELEGIDRLYLNVYVPKLTSAGGVAAFFRGYLGHRFASTKQAVEMTKAFVARIKAFVEAESIPLVHFEKGMRKDDVMQRHLRAFRKPEGVVFVGVAQEKARVPRTIRKRSGQGTIPWIDYSTAMVNFYYFYCLDRDFGPFFIKFCSYFPYPAKLCLNGHEFLKCQLRNKAVEFEALDNGLLSCADVPAAQKICDALGAEKIDAFFRRWLARLPHPFSPADRRAGYRYDLSVLQAEFSLTQVWEQGVHGRCFFEEVIRENLDLGRPETIQLIFGRRLRKSTVADGRCRTRIVTEGVIPSLHVYYKRTHLKQYHKEGRALRTETTINDTYDFNVGRRLHNLPRLREIGFAANRKVLEVEVLSHDCQIGAAAFEKLQRPAVVEGQKVSALRYGEERVQALLAVLLMFCLLPEGFRNQQLRPLLAQYLGVRLEQISPGRMSYELRRLRLRALIERIAGTHRYRLTSMGLKTALLYTRSYARVLRPGLSILLGSPPGTPELQRRFQSLEADLTRFIERKMAA